MVTRALFVLAALAACAGRGVYPGGAKPQAGRGIEAAGLPFHVLDRGGHELAEAAFWTSLAGARVVCVGEEHPNPHHHWVQLQVVRHLAKLWPQFALAMEMFQRPFQGVLDDYAARKIDDDALRSRTGWADRWGYNYELYRPIIASAVDAHATLLAANAPKELTKKVAHHGLESLAPDEKAQLPELDLNDKAHRAWFDALMEDMGGSEAHSKKPETEPKEPAAPPAATPTPAPAPAPTTAPAEADEMPSADRVYTVQVIWDETMADTAARWIIAHPESRVVILAGNGHCHDSAIVNRIKRRGVKDVVSVRAVIDDGEGSVAEAVAKPMNDFLVVLELPPDVKAKLKQDQEHGGE